MGALNPEFVDKIAGTCIDIYKKLPKTGKPDDKGWTVLSCIVQYNEENKTVEVVSLGTGTKCVGASKLSPKGDTLNDSHAEVMARRGFLIYLYDQIENVLDNRQSIFSNKEQNLVLKTNIKFIFYSSQLPCGDASIIPKIGDDELFGDVLNSYKRKPSCDSNEPELKKFKYKEDVHRTGAKCLPNSKQDPKEAGINYHQYGQVRTKPGRGDKTLSVSCTDKIARWIHLGIQGSLLSLILQEPIFVEHFIFGHGVPYSEESLQRGLLQRDLEKPTGFNLTLLPQFYQSSIEFPDRRKQENIRPAPGSILWVNGNIKILEVAVLGKKQGVTKKLQNTVQSALSITKVKLYGKFQKVLNKNVLLKKKLVDEKCMEIIPYNVMKKLATDYYTKWKEVKHGFFKVWTIKPDMWDFCVHSETV